MSSIRNIDTEKLFNTKAKITRGLVFAMTVTSLGSYSLGYSIGYSSPAVPDLQRSHYLDSDQISWFVSFILFGGTISSSLSGVINDRLGLKTSIMLTFLLYIIGFGFITFASGIAELYLGQFISGIACGIGGIAYPIYLSEISPAEYRGRIVTFGVQLPITVGILFAYSFGLTATWSVLSGLGLIAPLVGIIMTSFIPDSPRWLLMHSRNQDAKLALAWIRGGSYHDIEDEMTDCENNLDSNEKIPYSDYLKPGLLRPLKLTIGLMMLQNMSGINAIMFYTVTIFISAGLGSVSSLATVIIGLIQVICSVIACFQVDKFGRRKLLFYGAIGMALSHFLMAYYFHYTDNTKGVDTSFGLLPIISLSAFISSFALSWGPVPGLMMSEVFPQKYKSSACALTALIGWTNGLFITKEFPDLLILFGKPGTFIFFGIWCIIALLFVIKTVPETKGKSFEEIELCFTG